MATPSRALANLGTREQLDEVAQRILDFVPGAKELPTEARLALAQISVARGLDPFIGEVWGIPVKTDGRVVGFRIMIGIQAWRRSAHDSGEYAGRWFYDCTPEERAALGAEKGDLAVRCVVGKRKAGQRMVEFDGYGLYKKGERTKMNPLTCVRYRAERDAMKGAFPIAFGGGGGPMNVSVVGEDGEAWEPEPPKIQAPLTYGAAPAPVATVDATQNAGRAEPTLSDGASAGGGAGSGGAAGNGVNAGSVGRRPAQIKCNLDEWKRQCRELAQKFDHYRNGGGLPDMNRIQFTLPAIGFPLITPDKLEPAFEALAEHARVNHPNKAKAPQATAPAVRVKDEEIPF